MMLRKSLLFVLSFLLSGALGSQAQTSKPPSPEIIPPGFSATIVEIGQGGARTLHAKIVCPVVPSAVPMPAVIFVHGGGWATGSYDQVPLTLVYRGYFMASIEYRLSKEAPWPAQIEDCKLGVRWLRANAAKYNVDPNRIGCWGGSAGGHLVACLGTMDSPQLEGTGGYPGVSSKVQAVVDTSGPTDFTGGNFGTGGASITPKSLARDVTLEEALLGCPFAKNPGLWKQASPITWVRAGDPPFFILHSETDTIVAPQQATSFAAALQKVGVPVQLVMVHGAPAKGHSIAGGQPDQRTCSKQIVAFMDQYLKK